MADTPVMDFHPIDALTDRLIADGVPNGNIFARLRVDFPDVAPSDLATRIVAARIAAATR